MKRVNGITLIVGIWLVAAPFVLSYSTAQHFVASNDMVVGGLLIIASLWTLFEEMGRLEVTVFEVICGAWLLVAPFLSQGRVVPHVVINHVAVGAIVLISGLTQVSKQRQHHSSESSGAVTRRS